MKKSEIIVKRITKITLIVLAILTILMLIYIVVFFNSCKGTKLLTRKRYVGVEVINHENGTDCAFIYNCKKYYYSNNINLINSNLDDLELIGYDGTRWFWLSNTEYRKSNCCGESIIVRCTYNWMFHNFKDLYTGVCVNEDIVNEKIKLNNLWLNGEGLTINYQINLSQFSSEEIIDYTIIGFIKGTIGDEFSYYADLVQSNNKYYMLVDGIVEGKYNVFLKLDDEFINYVNEIEPGSFTQ